MQGKGDFKGQDLRGRSFKNQYLVTADFSGCDLRGVDFSEADLTKAKFCKARMGKTLKASFGQLLLQILTGSMSGALVGLSSILLLVFIEDILKPFGLNSDNNQLIFLVIYNLLFAFVILLAIYRKHSNYIICFFVLIIATATSSATSAVAATTAIAATAVVAVTTTATIAITTFVPATIITIATIIAVAVAVSDADAATAAAAAAATSIIYIVLGIYLGNRAIKKEEMQFLWLRQLAIKVNSFGGTAFTFATLQEVNFSGADLNSTHFIGANISSCRFRNVVNHHLALMAGTPLEQRRVRDLLASGITHDHDFKALNLQGLDFSGMDLSAFDFANANVSFANFSHCNLQDANLSEVNAIGTCFNKAQMTAACIKHWNIDTQTKLHNINCAYVYLADNEQQRNPPEGDFAIDEFSKLYQQISDTIDFIAHSREELDTLISAIEDIKAQADGEEITVQSIECKEDSILVKVKASVEFERNELYKKIKKSQKKIKQIKADYKQKLLMQGAEFALREKTLSEHKDLLVSLLKDSVLRPTYINNQLENKIVKEDHSRHQSVTGNNNRNVNFGDDSSLSYKVEQLSEKDTELNALLIQLIAIIEQSTLANEDKQDALDHANAIAEAWDKPKEQQQSFIAKALRSLKRFASDFKDIPELFEKYSDLLVKIAATI